MLIPYNDISKEILSGYYPQKNLLYIEDYSISKEEDIKKYDTADVKFILSILFSENVWAASFGKAKKLQKEYKQEFSSTLDPVSFLIDTKYCVDSFADTKFYGEAARRPAFVTDFDWVLGCRVFDSLILGGRCADNAYFFANVLRLIQLKELRTKRTINCATIEMQKVNGYELICGDWKEDSPLFVDLDEVAVASLSCLIEERKQMDTFVQAELNQQEQVAKKTEESWRLFLKRFNEISACERKAIRTIIDSDEVAKKEECLSDYYNYFLKDDIVKSTEEEAWIKVLKDVEERFKKARRFCCVTTEGKDPFLLDQSVISLLREPKSYISLLLSFHRFRISRKKNDAERFFLLATETLGKNIIGESLNEELRGGSIEELCEVFVAVFDESLQEPKVFENISYDDLQEGMALNLEEGVGWNLELMELGDSFEKSIKPIFLQNVDSLTDDDLSADEMIARINDILNNRVNFENHIIGEWVGYRTNEGFSVFEKEDVRIEYVFLAKRLIRSLDLLFLCSEALRIIISNHPNENYGVDEEHAKMLRNKLLDFDDEITHLVYGSKARKVQMLREEEGIKSESIAERERNQVEELRVITALEIIVGKITQIMISLKDKPSEEILEEKWSEIRMDLLANCPIARDSLTSIENSLDNLSQAISEKLISDRKDDEEFVSTRNGLIQYFKENYKIIPQEVLDTFATAELLFNKYAIPEVAEQGFDYSSISSLYYQAFEAMYNELLWKRYAEEVNESATIDGKAFSEAIEILWESNLTQKEKLDYDRVEKAAGNYFYSIRRERNNYVERKNGRRRLKTYCTYTNFAIMLRDCVKDRKTIKYAEFLAKLFGYKDEWLMRRDARFMARLLKFANEVKSASEDRNNASHGGEIIHLEQCMKDKKRVLNELESERTISLGLALQLLDLFPVQ